jgi:phosphoribosylcarboxyaminoimidazole (NCAIR) mutase
MAIGGGKNAGLMAVRILATASAELTEKLEKFAADQRLLVEEMNVDLVGR